MTNALVVQKRYLPQSHKTYRAAQYVRMSTDYQQYSITNQAAAIAIYAQTQGLTIVRTYRDEGESGLTIKGRQGLTELINDISTGHADFEHLLIFDVSRWGRFQDVDESAYYEFICRKGGVSVAYCSEQFVNDGSLLSSIIKNIKRVMAAEYSRELSAKVFAASSRLAGLGYKMGGPAPFGLHRKVVDDHDEPKGILRFGERKFLMTDRVRLVPGQPEDVRTVRWIFDEYLSGKSQAYLARELNRCRILNGTGRKWIAHTVGDLLRNEVYIGIGIYNRRTSKLKTKQVANPREVWVCNENAIDPIISRDVFQKVQTKIAERRICVSEEEMLLRLRKLLLRKKRLSAAVIKSSRGLPSLTAYLSRFGTLQEIFRLVGYNGSDDYYEKLAEHRQRVSFLLDQALLLRSDFEQAGCHVEFDRSVECMQIDKRFNICFRIARCRTYPGHAPRWTLVRRRHWPTGWLVVARLQENNESILDYALLRSEWVVFKGRLFAFSRTVCAGHDIDCFESFDQISRSLIRSISAELAKSRSMT